MERETQGWNNMVEYSINKLLELRLQAEWEDRQRGKKRYISKVSAYNDLIKLLQDIKEGNI